jgi:hypothetical protein
MLASRCMWRIWLLALLALLTTTRLAISQAQPALPGYGATNTFSVFGEYSNDSSHILIGVTEQRKLLNFGGAYSRKLFTTRLFDFRYMAELRPVILESDPIVHSIISYTLPKVITLPTTTYAPVSACHTGTSHDSYVYNGIQYTYTITDTCSRQWTWGQGLSPVGIKINFLPHRRLQPVFTGLGGYMFSTKPIPVSGAGSANFTFEFGAGVEFYSSSTRSIRAEYRYHHISNNYTAMENPGIDSGMLQISYSFGR